MSRTVLRPALPHLQGAREHLNLSDSIDHVVIQ
jgi:hypothetical protein